LKERNDIEFGEVGKDGGYPGVTIFRKNVPSLPDRGQRGRERWIEKKRGGDIGPPHIGRKGEIKKEKTAFSAEVSFYYICLSEETLRGKVGVGGLQGGRKKTGELEQSGKFIGKNN